MKRPISLLIFILIAIIIDFYIGYLFFPAFMMLTQYHLAILLGNNYYYIFYSILVLLLASIVTLIVGLFRLKGWAYYIFVILTLLLNFLMSFIYIYDLVRDYFNLRLDNLIFIMFTICFIFYFLKPSTRRLFDRWILPTIGKWGAGR